MAILRGSNYLGVVIHRRPTLKLIEIVFLAAGGLAGTFLRYWITKSPLVLGALPVNVLIVNIVGSFILGLFAAISQQWSLDERYTFLIAIGFCGGLTTMSSFALETSNLIDNRLYSLVVLDILTNVGLSLGSVFGGKVLASAILGGVR